MSIIYPSKHIPLSACVLLIRPKLGKNENTPLNYELLILRRNPKISFGNYYAFPGGMIEPQDRHDHWSKKYPSYLSKVKSYDFTKRITAIRELYEECGILLANG